MWPTCCKVILKDLADDRFNCSPVQPTSRIYQYSCVASDIIANKKHHPKETAEAVTVCAKRQALFIAKGAELWSSNNTPPPNVDDIISLILKTSLSNVKVPCML